MPHMNSSPEIQLQTRFVNFLRLGVTMMEGVCLLGIAKVALWTTRLKCLFVDLHEQGVVLFCRVFLFVFLTSGATHPGKFSGVSPRPGDLTRQILCITRIKVQTRRLVLYDFRQSAQPRA